MSDREPDQTSTHPTEPDQTPIRRLRALSDDPEQQARYALELLDAPEATFDVLAALRVLREQADPAYRKRLVDLYRYNDTSATRRDPGATVRREILAALRGIATSEDVGLLEAAATRVEWLPPGPSEVAAPLRSAALLTLATVDPERSVIYAAYLLRDPHVDRMNGEPALSAVRVLAAFDRTELLLDYVLAPGEAVPETVTEAVAALTDLPCELLGALTERLLDRGDSAATVGWLDLIAEHPHGGDFEAELRGLLQATDDLDLYRYGVMQSLASRKPGLVRAVMGVAAYETRPEHVRALIEGLEPRTGQPEADELLERLKAQLGARR